MADRYDLSVPIPGKDGKTFWHRIGTMFPQKNGKGYAIMLNSIPAPQVQNNGENGWRIMAFEASDYGADYSPSKSAQSNLPLDDEVKF